MLTWGVPGTHDPQGETVFRFFKAQSTWHNSGCDILTWAIYHEKLDIVKTVLKLAQESEQGGAWKIAGLSLWQPNGGRDAWSIAMRLGRTAALELLVKATGSGINYAKLESAELETGVTKPQYYLGLTLHGKKRKDWANAANPNKQNTEPTHQLVHYAAYYGCMDTCELLLAGIPFSGC